MFLILWDMERGTYQKWSGMEFKYEKGGTRYVI